MFLKDRKKTALIYNDKDISYRNLLKNISFFATKFTIKPNERVVVFSESQPEWVYAFYSIWKNNGICTPLDFMLPEDELEFMLNDCKPTIIFTSQKQKEKINKVVNNLDFPIQVIVLEKLSKNIEQESDKFLVQSIDVPDYKNVALMIYTSGTTGSPKAVQLTFDNLLNNLNFLVKDSFNPQKNDFYLTTDTTITILPLHHILPLLGSIIAPLFYGSSIVLLTEVTPESMFSNMKKHQVTLLFGVPRLYEMFHAGIINKMKNNKIAKTLLQITRFINNPILSRILFKKVHAAFGGKMRYWCCGGAAFDINLLKDLHAMGFIILEGFGMSETSPMVTCNRMGNYKLGSAGLPITGVDIKIEDEELLIKGGNVMKGYYNRAEETKNAFTKDGWLHTGDKARIDKQGWLYITGRLKDIIVLPNGKNINPIEIEQKILANFPLVKEIGIIENKNKLHAIIFPDFKYANDNNISNLKETIKWEIIDKYNLKSANYKKIFQFEIVDQELPKTRIGKLKRFSLKEILKTSSIPKATIKDPDIPEYKVIHDFISEITGQTIHPDAHIELDLGMDSLDKLELQEKIERTFGLSLKNSEIAKYQKVQDLAKYISTIKTKFQEEKIKWGEILKNKIDHFKIPRFNFLFSIILSSARPLVKFYFKIEPVGMDKIPKDTPVIFVPNHQSALDGVIITTILKNNLRSKTYYFAKDKNFKSTWKRIFAKHGNILLMNINVDLKHSLQRLASLISRGKNVVIFPEGARSRDGKIGKFKKTFAILSKELNTPIIPVVINGSYKAMSIGSKLPKPSKIEIEFLDPVYPEKDKDYDFLSKKVKKLITDKLNY